MPVSVGLAVTCAFSPAITFPTETVGETPASPFSPCGPVSPVAPAGITKSKETPVSVGFAVTCAFSPAVTFPTTTVGEAPSSPFSPFGPVAPVGP